MKLLFLTMRSPYPPHSGGLIRAWELLNFLAPRHELTLVYFASAPDQIIPPEITSLGIRVLALPHPVTLSPADLLVGQSAPAPIKGYGSQAMFQMLSALDPSSFDWALIDSLYLTLYRALFPRAVLMEQNIESQLFKQYLDHHVQRPGMDTAQENALWSSTWRQMQFYENRVWRDFPLRTVVSARDKHAMDSRCKVGKTLVVANGVNLTTHPFLEPNRSRTLLLPGAFGYFPNVDAAFQLVREIMPRVWHVAPDVRVILAGHNPDAILATLAADPRVELIPNPPDIARLAAQARCMVVPLRFGTGTRLKILEAQAWGLPVISTTIGCAGLNVTNGENILIRDTPDAIAAAVLQVLDEAPLYNRLRSAGRAYVKQCHDWQSIFQPFEQLLMAESSATTHA